MNWLPSWVIDHADELAKLAFVVMILIVIVSMIFLFFAFCVICKKIFNLIKNFSNYVKSKYTPKPQKLKPTKIDGQLKNIGNGILETLSYIESAREIASDCANSEIIKTSIDNIEIHLLKYLDSYTPLENEKFDFNTMEFEPKANNGELVKKTITPGKKIGNLIIKKALVELKDGEVNE